MYDYSKLLGRIRELGFTQESLSKSLSGAGKMSLTSLNLSLNNRRMFRQDEIIGLCGSLRIPYDMIPVYFFTAKLQKSEVAGAEHG